MLSPASHRVCCLAVMAPALTKADRQADCLPVVLSESFCVSNTDSTFNGEQGISEIRLKCSYSDYTNNKRKPFMHRACWRTPKNNPDFLCKYRSLTNDSSKSLLFASRVRAQRETKSKTWQSTKAATAYADKIKLKYTMSRNNTTTKNMGLAKANASLGIQSLKMKRFSKENHNTSPVAEDSLHFSDSTDSTMQVEPTDLTTLTSNSDSDVCPMDCNTVSCISNSERTCEATLCNEVDMSCKTAVSESALESNSQPLLTTAGSNSIEAMDASNTSVILTDLLCSTPENIENSNILCTDLNVTDIASIDSEVVDQNASTELQSSVKDSVLEILEQSEVSLPSETDSVISFDFLNKEVSVSNRKIFEIPNDVKESTFKNSSGSDIMSHSTIVCSKLCENAARLHPACKVQITWPVLHDYGFGISYMPVRKDKKPCCLLSNEEILSLESAVADKETSVTSVLASSTISLHKPLSLYIKNQISKLVDHYQRKFQIPCQRPAKHVNTKSGKDLVDLKAELLQSEDVKNMSTAALVNLVRKLESSGSQAKILSPKASISSTNSDLTENAHSNFDHEDITDIKDISTVFLKKVHNVLKLSDPDLTDSSEEESEIESEDEETIENNSFNKIPLWKYLKDRGKLGSRSTWLIARLHELDYRVKEYNEHQIEIIKSEGRICLEEPLPSTSSALSNQESLSFQTCTKQAAVKSFLPLNGFLDPNDASHISKTTTYESILSELEDPERTESNIEVEECCCRTRPLNIGAFRKRKLVFISGLHTKPKFSRLSSVSCNCKSRSNLAPCILCTGQYTSIQNIDPDSMALRDRIAILDPYFHPALSTEKDIPLVLHMENILRCHPKFQFVPEASVSKNVGSEATRQVIRPKFSDLRSHRKLTRYARSLSAKYRKKHHARNVKHLRKHKLVFGKWRRFHNKHALRARSHFRRFSIASSCSSPDSPVHSPMSVFDDGMGYEKKRRDDSQFDIDDVIIPCNSRSGRLVEIQYKEIMIPSWRNTEGTCTDACNMEEVENITDSYLNKRHDMLQIEEKEKVKRSALNLNKRGRRIRCDSRADSSGANTPDPNSLYNQDVFQVPNFTSVGGPASPASPLAIAGSAASDDSQPASGNSLLRPDNRKLLNQKRGTEENTSNRPAIDFDEVLPYEPLIFPLPDEVYEELLADTDHDKEVFDLVENTQSFPASPVTSSSSTSTVEEDEDITDPEWTVVKPMGNGLDQALVLKFAKR